LAGGGAPEGASPTLADLLSAAGASPETLRNLDRDDTCAAALRAHGLRVARRADGTLEIELDPGQARGKVRITFEPG
jgi:hypothetical protein